VILSRHELHALAISVLALSAPARAQDDRAAELAKKLANPVASLISVPLQYNHDDYGGANDGAQVDKLVIQPVLMLPTATDDALGTEKWGIGPTGVADGPEGWGLRVQLTLLNPK
jgi:hypothetical protein